MSTGPHDLAGWLRAQSDDALAELLTLRPDLLHPVPPDVSVLAARATGRASVEVALDRLDLGTLEVLDLLTALPEPLDVTTAGRALATAGATGDAAAEEALHRLRATALIWGPDDDIRVAPVAKEVLARGNPWSTSPTGPSVRSLLADLPVAQLQLILEDLAALPGITSTDAGDTAGRIADILTDSDQLRAVLAASPAAAREVLNLLVAGPPVGRVPDARRPVHASTADSPVRWLIAHGLIVAVDDTTVVLPREVAAALRGSEPSALALQAPELDVTLVNTPDADAAAAGQAFNVVRLVEALLERWGIDPPAVLKAGGLGVRDLRATARELDLEEPAAALLIEISHAAGLIGQDTETAEVWLPTLGYDLWLAQSISRRWAGLAAAWLTTTRAPGLIGRKDQAPDAAKAPNALGPDVDRALGPERAPRPAAAARHLAGRLRRRAARRSTARIRWSTPGEAAGCATTSSSGPWPKPNCSASRVEAHCPRSGGRSRRTCSRPTTRRRPGRHSPPRCSATSAATARPHPVAGRPHCDRSRPAGKRVRPRARPHRRHRVDRRRHRLPVQ